MANVQIHGKRERKNCSILREAAICMRLRLLIMLIINLNLSIPLAHKFVSGVSQACT